tara:strand:+ start:411 stop:668 length:258 start_codon:yes stop_codon:yes gene_type:complete
MKWLLKTLNIRCTYLRIGLNVWWFAPYFIYNCCPRCAARFAQFFDLYDYEMAERNSGSIVIRTVEGATLVKVDEDGSFTVQEHSQ